MIHRNVDAKKRPTILVVEDEVMWHTAFKRIMQQDKVDLIFAETVEEATRLFGENPHISMIILDGVVPDAATTAAAARAKRMGITTTVEFAAYVRSRSDVPIIASSSDESFRVRLVEAGCSHQSAKQDVRPLVLQILKST